MMTILTIKRYSELILIPDFEGRFNYLKIPGSIGMSTFGYDRWLNQQLYKSTWWKRIREEVIVRDNGFDMGLDGYPIGGHIFVHHMNPIRVKDILHSSDNVGNLDFLISVSAETHRAIHYTDDSLFSKTKDPVNIFSGDQSPWKRRD